MRHTRVGSNDALMEEFFFFFFFFLSCVEMLLAD